MTGRAMQVICLIAVLIGVAPLIALVVATVSKGAGALSIGFLLHAPTPEGVPGGGISTAIVGSGEIVAYAVALAVPLGLFVALFLFERGDRSPRRSASAPMSCPVCRRSSSASSLMRSMSSGSTISRTWRPASHSGS